MENLLTSLLIDQHGKLLEDGEDTHHMVDEDIDPEKLHKAAEIRVQEMASQIRLKELFIS